MRTTDSSEYPKHPLPPPVPEQPQGSEHRQPMVYVYENQAWEYRIITREATDAPLSEDELNALGRSGWELVGVSALAGKTSFFFKRPRP